jgi:hypothetical protein
MKYNFDEVVSREALTARRAHRPYPRETVLPFPWRKWISGAGTGVEALRARVLPNLRFRLQG